MKLLLILAMVLAIAGSIGNADAQDAPDYVSSHSTDSGDLAVEFYTEAVTSKTPYIAGIRSSASDVNYCAGALIAPRFILTSNDCAPKNGTNEFIVIGSLLAQGNTDHAVPVVASDVTVHPKYNVKTKEYDFLLIKLKSASKLTRVSLVPASTFEYGSTGDVLGWNTTLSVSTSLHSSSVWFLSAKDCGSLYDSQLCAVRLNTTDTCYANPGSPLIINKSGTEILVGIVSKPQACGKPIVPAVSSRVEIARSWIQKIAGV